MNYQLEPVFNRQNEIHCSNSHFNRDFATESYKLTNSSIQKIKLATSCNGLAEIHEPQTGTELLLA